MFLLQIALIKTKEVVKIKLHVLELEKLVKLFY